MNSNLYLIFMKSPMYIFCLIMLILSVLGIVANLILIYINKATNVNDLLRALLMLITSISFYTLLRYHKRKRG